MTVSPLIPRLSLLCAAVLVCSASAAAQTPSADAGGDISAGYSIMRDSASLTFNGFRASGAKNLSGPWAAVVEVGVEKNGSGVYRSSSGTNSFTYTDTSVLGGVRLRRNDGSSSTLFFQALGGYFARTDDLTSPATSAPSNGHFAIRAEGGVDVHVSTHVALRFGGGWTFLSSGLRYMNQIGANAGVSYLFGKR